MAFAFMDIMKIKSEGQMTSKYRHNCRKIDIDNVIPELSENNEELVALPVEGGKELNYREAWQKRIASLPYYKDHPVRSNAVLGYEVLLTFSRDANIDIEAWKKQSLEWLHKTFDVAPDKQSNLLHVAYHADEVGNVHIHAFVVPIDERGRLNAKRFTDGSKAMSELQSSYAASVADLGLERGLAGSSAKHKDIRRMYAGLNNAINAMPVLEDGETIEEYKNRLLEQMKTVYAAGKRESDDYAVKMRREVQRQLMAERDASDMEIAKTKKIMLYGIDKLKAKKEDLEQGVATYEQMMEELTEQMIQLQLQESAIQQRMLQEMDMENNARYAKCIQSGMEELYELDPAEAELMEEDLSYLVELGIQREGRLSAEQQYNVDESLIDENGETIDEDM